MSPDRHDSMQSCQTSVGPPALLQRLSPRRLRAGAFLYGRPPTNARPPLNPALSADCEASTRHEQHSLRSRALWRSRPLPKAHCFSAVRNVADWPNATLVPELADGSLWSKADKRTNLCPSVASNTPCRSSAAALVTSPMRACVATSARAAPTKIGLGLKVTLSAGFAMLGNYALLWSLPPGPYPKAQAGQRSP